MLNEASNFEQSNASLGQVINERKQSMVLPMPSSYLNKTFVTGEMNLDNSGSKKGKQNSNNHLPDMLYQQHSQRKNSNNQ